MKHEKVDTRLLSKEESIGIFLKNSNEIMTSELAERYKYFIPENLEKIAEELFSLPNVFVTTCPIAYHFDKNNGILQDVYTDTFRGGFDEEKTGILSMVNYYLNKGAIVYLYQYYGMKSDIVMSPTEVKKDVPTTWWRMAVKKEI